MSKSEQFLIEKYGLMLTLSQVAELFHRSEAGLSYSLSRKGEFADRLNRAKVKNIGRRVYFRAADIAAILDSEDQQ